MTTVTPMIGDLFESRAQTLVNTVNTVGVMGKGIALTFKERYPAMYRDYAARCRRGEVHLGQPYLYVEMFGPWILNFPTKDHWRSTAKLTDIVAGLEHLELHFREWGVTSLAVPPLGCGEGGLEWRVVGPTLYRHLARLGVPVELYAPFGTPHEQLEPSFLAGRGTAEDAGSLPFKVSPAAVALVEILARVQREVFHWPTGRIAFQKIAYFATQAGIPTGLTYVEGSYGPYAAELRRVQSRLENNGLLVEQRSGPMFVASPGPTFPDARRTMASHLNEWNDRIEGVVDLLLRFDTRKAEVAATVHYATQVLAKELQREPTEIEVLNYVLHWKRRRVPAVDPREVGAAIRHLYVLGWIRVAVSDALPLPASEKEGVA